MLGFTNPTEVPWHVFTGTAAAALAARLRENFAPNTVNRMMAAVRGTLNVCRIERWFVLPQDLDGYRPSHREHYDSLVDHLKGKKQKGRTVGRILSDEEMQALFASCQKDGRPGARDAVILALGIGANLRREEIADLELHSVDLKTGVVTVIAGKGDKNRTTALAKVGLAAVRAWLKYRGTAAGPLITGPDGSGVGPQTIWRYLTRRREAAGVAMFAPHDMRRTFAARQRRAGTPLNLVRLAMGHADIKTTAQYDVTEIDEIVTAIQQVDLPWEKK